MVSIVLKKRLSENGSFNLVAAGLMVGHFNGWVLTFWDLRSIVQSIW